MKIKVSEKMQLALVTGISLIISAYIFGTFFYNAKNAGNTIKVTGSAMKRISSDLVKWSVFLNRKNITSTEMKQGYANIRHDADFVVAALTANGIKPEEISVLPSGAEQQYDKSSQPIDKYSLHQEITINSKNIDKVEFIASNPNILLDKNMVLQSANLQYLNTDLTNIKKELIAYATKDAMQRAQELSKKAGIKIGKLIEARVGVFQINAPNSTEVSDYGNYSTATREKDISVPVTVSFVLK